jgi:hypothetical protein
VEAWLPAYGWADWVSSPNPASPVGRVIPSARTDFLTMNNQGTSRIHGFGARMQFDRLVSRIELEEIDAPSMAHLNLVTASVHYAF